ncbi:MAG: FHA domain-containing protein [Planctomycetaceae bacterium]|nr:FHA domain-containing protein [Planctomycetales bacterium]MCB9926663.1 FHA domain-containing protein [Planctomycetaceae bacterium]
MASLFVIQGSDQGRRYDLDDDAVSLGRDNDNSIQLHDSEVSRHHAEVRIDVEGYLLVDLNSSNGSFVNGSQITEHQLENGDRVQLGRTLMIFTGGDGSSSLSLADEVDIVGQSASAAGSRIIHSMSHEEGSQIVSAFDESDSPWLARARSNLQIMYRTALAVSHTLDIDQLLHRIMELIFEWVEADRGCIMLQDQQTNELVPKVSRNRRHREDREKERLEISRTILDYVLEQREGVLTSDAKDDQRWDPAASIVKMGIREAICVPMQGRYGIVGVIYIDTYTAPGRFIQRAGNKFSEEHLKLMVAIAHQAALAIEDTSYYSAMVQAERLAAMGQTIATLSHHIKNILQGIRGGSYLIEEGLKNENNDIVRKGWSIVDKNQEKISNLVMDMLTFSKDREPELVPSDVNEVVTDVLELMVVRAKSAGVELKKNTCDSIPELLFDPELLHRAILNVVTNAIDACEASDPGRVAVSTEHSTENHKLRVIVEDNGGGIEESDIKRIFSVFESRKGARGTGLGLPVSQKILREHGGDIFVESTLGVGSRFILEWPAIIPDPSNHSDTLTGFRLE